MNRFTRDNFSTAFQLTIIALLFIYPAFPGKSIVIKKPVVTSFPVDKSIRTHKEVMPDAKDWLYNDKLSARPENSSGLGWIMPDMKNILNTRTKISANQSGNKLKTNTK